MDDGSGNYQNLTDLEGYNWIDSVTYTETSGSPTATASVKLKREAHKLSLSPFMDGSKLNASGSVIDIARKILIETAVLPRGKKPASNEWEKVFRGYIEKIAWAKSPLTLSCQDLGSELLGRFIETQRVYAETDNLLHEVIQDIADDTSPDVAVVAANYTWPGGLVLTTGDTSEVVVGDFIGIGNGTLTNRSPYFEIAAITPNVDITIVNPIGRTVPTGTGAGDTSMIPAVDRVSLYVEGANPTWAIQEYYQSKDRVLTALRKLAQQIGYEVSYRWNTTTADFELTLWTPDRSAATPDVTIGPGVFKNIQKLDIDRSKIRNRIMITAMVAGVRTTTIREDAASKAKYHRRYMEATEKSTSQINTVAEMNDFGAIILSDLKEPEADLVGSIPYRWDIQPADYARFEADGVRFDTDQDMGIVSLKHVWPNRGEPKTTLAIRGKPGGGVNRWLELEGMPGVSLPVDLKSDTAAENAVATPSSGGIVVVYDDPRATSPPVDDWAYTRCYVREGADPGDPPGSAYLVDVKKATRFEITGLIPEATYYCRLVIIDQAGNIADTAVVVSVATEGVGAYHENHDHERGPMNANSNFGTATKAIATNEPDHWGVVSTYGTWANTAGNWWHQSGTGAIHLSGKRAVELNGIACPGGGTINRRFQTMPFSASADYLFCVAFAWRHNGNTGNKTVWRPQIVWLDEDRIFISAVNLIDTIHAYSGTGFTSTPNVWHIDRGWATAPATARYARVWMDLAIPTAAILGQASHPTMFFDRFLFTRSMAQLEWSPSAGTDRINHVSGTWKAPWLDATYPDIDNVQGASRGVPGGPVEHDYDVQFDGQYLIEGIVAWTAGTNGKAFNARIRKNGATLRTGTPNIKYAGSGGYGSVFMGQVALSAGDAIRLEGYHNEGANLTIDNSECALRITQISTQGSY